MGPSVGICEGRYFIIRNWEVDKCLEVAVFGGCCLWRLLSLELLNSILYDLVPFRYFTTLFAALICAFVGLERYFASIFVIVNIYLLLWILTAISDTLSGTAFWQ